MTKFFLSDLTTLTSKRAIQDLWNNLTNFADGSEWVTIQASTNSDGETLVDSVKFLENNPRDNSDYYLKVIDVLALWDNRAYYNALDFHRSLGF